MLATRVASTLPEPFETMARQMDRVFGEIPDGVTSTVPQAPAALWEDDQSVCLEIEVPGLREEDLQITVQDGRLLIAGERKAPQRSGKCWFNEHKYGRFERLIALSDTIDTDSIQAELADGVLHLSCRRSRKRSRIALRSPSASRTGRPAWNRPNRRSDAEASLQLASGFAASFLTACGGGPRGPPAADRDRRR